MPTSIALLLNNKMWSKLIGKDEVVTGILEAVKCLLEGESSDQHLNLLVSRPVSYMIKTLTVISQADIHYT